LVAPSDGKVHFASRSPGRAIEAVGGGARTRVWMHPTSDVSVRALTLRAATIAASYGDAFLAALAVGDVSREAISAWNPKVPEVAANAGERGLYRRQYELFSALSAHARSHGAHGTLA
jgi:xylulokinase